MIPNSIKIPVPFEYVFPNGALYLGVDKLVDFDRIREEDNQARDENGERIWVVKVMDLDPQAGRFGRSTEVKVKIASRNEPEPPETGFPGTRRRWRSPTDSDSLHRRLRLQRRAATRTNAGRDRPGPFARVPMVAPESLAATPVADRGLSGLANPRIPRRGRGHTSAKSCRRPRTTTPPLHEGAGRAAHRTHSGVHLGMAHPVRVGGLHRQGSV